MGSTIRDVGAAVLGLLLAAAPAAAVPTTTPAACFAAYEAARLAGVAPLAAFSQIYFTDASCFPGVRALLDGTGP